MNNDAAGLLDTPKFDTFYRVFKKALKIKGRANLLAFYLIEHPWSNYLRRTRERENTQQEEQNAVMFCNEDYISSKELMFYTDIGTKVLALKSVPPLHHNDKKTKLQKPTPKLKKPRTSPLSLIVARRGPPLQYFLSVN